MEIGMHILFIFIGFIIGIAFGICSRDTTRCRTCKYFRLDECKEDKCGICKFDSVQGSIIEDCDKAYCGSYEPGKYFQK